MKTKMRLISLLLVFVMLLGLMPTTALAVTNGSGTQQSPLSVTTYEELKAALADNTTQYIVVNEFETNYDDGNGGFYQINQAIAEDYALYSNPAVDKHLTINTAVRISTSAQCTNVKTGLEVGGNLTIDGTGIFNMSFYGTESRCVVVNVPKSGKLIVNGQVTIYATSVWYSDEINQEAESIHSKGHIVFNGGTFIGYFSRVSSTMGSVYAVYVEVGRSEYYGGNFKTVNHSAVDNGVQIDKGCEGGVILINRPSANGTKKVPELTILKGGTFQSIVIVNYEDTSDVIGNLLVGCRLYDADDKHELDEYYALNYVHNATVLKYNLDITFDANGGKGLMKKVTFNTLSNDYFALPESNFYAPQGKRFKCWSIDGIEKAVGETFEPTKDTVIFAVWVDIPANELGGKGTKESPLYVNTYAELKAALADDVTEYIIVKDFLYTNDGGYHLINNPIDGEDYALWSNPDIHKHLTIDTKVRLGVYLACPNITKGIEVTGKLTIDGSGSFNTSFLSNKRGTVINVTSTGTLIVEDPVTIDATSIWHTEQHNIEAEAIHSKGHLTINGGTFKGHFNRVSSTSVTLNAVYVEAGKAEFYGGDFRTVNTKLSVDKGCEGGLLVVSNPSANNGKDIDELIKLYGGTYQRFAVSNLGNKQWKASDLMVGSDFLDAETGNAIAAKYFDTTYIPNLRVEKHTWAVEQIALSLATPVEGESISSSKYKVTDSDDAFNANNKTIQWQVSTDGGMTYTDVAADAKFIGGCYYRFFIDVQTNSGYEFALDKNNDPAVDATVNGNPTTVFKAWEQDPTRTVTVCYHVGMCNERLIKKVEIVNLEAPYPGKTPDYTATTYGTAYSLENSTGTDYMTDKLYKSNGIVWYDENGDYLLYDQPFEAGKTYRVKIYLDITDTEKFEFDQKDGVTNVTGTINGNPATVTAETVNAFWNHYIEYTFEWQPITITEINITGLDVPVAGENPDFDVELNEGHDQLYSVSVTWYEYYGDGKYGAPVVEDATFAENTVYRAEIVLEPKKDAQYVVNLCSFAVSEQTIRINGKSPVEPWLSNTYVSVSYDFQTVTEIEPSVNVSGFVQADFGTVKPSAALYSTNDTEHTNPLYTAEIGSAVKNGDRFDWAFTISDVPAGTYDLVITKDGHQNSVQRITVSSTNKNVGVIDLSVLATSTWSGDSCTVTLEVFEEDVSVMVASYKNGKLEKVEYLTMYYHTATLSGDNVKVFFLNDETHAPIRKVMEMIKT